MTPGMGKGVGVIFVGGKASRLGGINKADIRVANRTCFDRTHSVLAATFETVAVSVSKNSERELPTILDWPSADNDGGVVFSVLSIMKWASENGFDFAITSPCDTPFLPERFPERLAKHHESNAPIVCMSGGRTQYLHALWPVSIYEPLKSLVLNKGERKIGRIHQLLVSKTIMFEAEPYDPFFNINTPEHLKQAEKMASQFSL